MKHNKEEGVQLMEDIYRLLSAIVGLHIKSETAGILPPGMLHEIGKFTETLHKINTYVEAQQDGNKITQFFRQSEMNLLLKDCRTGLQQALEVFKVDSGVAIFTDITNLQRKTQEMHMELLELISNLSDGTASDRSSSIYKMVSSPQNSSNSFSILPAMPKIFHGREVELRAIIATLSQESARIGILGPGGMGKTTLAKAALHHPSIAAKYEHRFFVTTDSATTSIELAALIGAHIGLKPGRDLTKAVVQYFSRDVSYLLVLDNLETVWEPMGSRAGVEEFLSLLTDLPHLALMITMRGAERPGKVHWTHPFLLPLKSLPHDAARQTFIDIADDFHNSTDIDHLLLLTDNMPLAVNLIAHLVDQESCSSILARWETEKTSLLSDGYDTRQNLDASIALSLSSPRIASLPGAKDLLSLLSILPDGLSNVELIQSRLPIQDILGCKAALLRTSLAYLDDRNFLRALVPIREYMKLVYPPSSSLISPLRKHFHLLLDLYQKYRGVDQKDAKINQISSNLGNVSSVLLLGLDSDNPDLSDTVHCTISFNCFGRLTGSGRTPLMGHIPTILPQLCDERLEVQYITEELSSGIHGPIANAQQLIDQATSHFHYLHDPTLESKFYLAIGSYHHYHGTNLPMAMQFFEKALILSRSFGNTKQETLSLNNIAQIKWQIGDYSTAQTYAWQVQKLVKLETNLYEEARALRTEALCGAAHGNYGRSLILYEEARRILGLSGMTDGFLDRVIMFHMAELHLLKSEYTEAYKTHVQLVKSTSSGQDPYNHAFGLLNSAEIGVLINLNEHDVSQNLAKAKTIFNTLEISMGVISCDSTLADLMLREGHLLTAKNLLQQCLNVAWTKDTSVVVYCLERLANVSRWSDVDIDFSARWTVIYLAYAQKAQEKLAVHKALRFLGDVHLSEGDQDTAHNLFIVALEGFTYMDVHSGRADCMLRLGDIAQKRGDFAKAIRLWKDARPLFERSLQEKELVQVDNRLAAVHHNMFDTPEKTVADHSDPDVSTTIGESLDSETLSSH